MAYRHRIAALCIAFSFVPHIVAQPSDGDRLAVAMLEMRLIGTVVEAYQQEEGTYPSVGESLQPVRNALRAVPKAAGVQLSLVDPWGRPYQYRAGDRSYQVISFGADRDAGASYGGPPVGLGALTEVVESNDESDDLILFDGRFTKRPFGELDPALRTVNAMVRISIASSSYAIDNNRYPGEARAPAPVAELLDDLVPNYAAELAVQDGWGRPILFVGDGHQFYLFSFGPDGKQDRVYYPDLPCGVVLADARPTAMQGADIVMACGRFLVWPAGIDP